MSMRFGCGHTRYEDSCNECFMIGENTRLLSTLEACRAELAKFPDNRCPSCGYPEEPGADFPGWVGMKARAEAAEAALKDSRELYAVAESLRQHTEAELAEARAEVAKLIQSTGEHITVRSELRAENAALLAKIEKMDAVLVEAEKVVRCRRVWGGMDWKYQGPFEALGKAVTAALSPAHSTPTKEK